MRKLALASAALALGACATVGPDYRPPAAPGGGDATLMSARSPAFTGDEPPGRWWSLLRDPVLDGLIEEALRANTDLRVAAANLRRARAALREVRAGQLPSTEISGAATYGQEPGGPEGELYDAGLGISYQLDLFGGIRRAVEAGRADAEAVQAAFDLTRITVASETARAYADACSAGRQLQVAEESLRVQERTFDLTRRLFEGGRATALETNQAGSLLEQTRAAIPAFQAQRQTALFRLSVLTGRAPADFPREVATCATPPRLVEPIPVGDGAALIARRPDIRAAERDLAAATARIGVATAELYPSITLGASVGSTSTSPGGLLSSEGFRFSLGPLISWTFPNAARARARIAQAEASAEGALAAFDGAWLRALEETESALTRYAAELDRSAALRRARDQSAEAARIARLRYQAGRESFQVVLDAERALAATDAALAQSEAALSDRLILLFLALGGGWNNGV